MTSGIKYLIPDTIRQKIHPRQLQAFSIGTPKSGTTSVAGLFNQHFRSSHEPERIELIHVIHRHFHGKMSDEAYVKWLVKRDKRIWLDIESNCFLGYRPDLLFKAYPKAHYLLSIREPLSWLDSMLNHTINYPPPSEQVIAYWHDMFFRPSEHPHQAEDKALREHNVYSIEAYLKFWSSAVTRVLDCIPKEQLLIVPTKQMKSMANEIAAFLNIEPAKLDYSAGHLNKAPAKFNLLELVDTNYVAQRHAEFCMPVLTLLEKDYGVRL
ncbi:sulfotransferase [Aliikangiella sp. IMCC44653]